MLKLEAKLVVHLSGGEEIFEQSVAIINQIYCISNCNCVLAQGMLICIIGGNADNRLVLLTLIVGGSRCLAGYKRRVLTRCHRAMGKSANFLSFAIVSSFWYIMTPSSIIPFYYHTPLLLWSSLFRVTPTSNGGSPCRQKKFWLQKSQVQLSDSTADIYSYWRQLRVMSNLWGVPTLF